MENLARVALIGFGEVGRILAGDLKAEGVGEMAAYDLLFDADGSDPARAAAALEVAPRPSATEAVKGAHLIISAVTAAQALAAATSVTEGIEPGAYFLDLNSASPGTKTEAFKVIEAAGGRYIEAAVMSSVPGKGLRTPMLLGGPYAQDFLEFAEPLGMNAKVFSETVGRASATKMCRSVMIKGTEALLAECLLTARHYGVETTVLDSLGDMLPNPDWDRLARYMISRSLIHGKRRAEEMREVARTVEEAGLDSWMSRAIAERQDWAWPLAAELPDGAVDDADLVRFLDSIRGVMPEG